MKHKILIAASIFSIVSTYNMVAANEPTKAERSKLPIEFRKKVPNRNIPKGESDGTLIGSYDGTFLQLDFSEFEGLATVECTNLMTGDNCTYSTSGNGSSYQYIGEISGPVQITVTTSESTYECVTFVE